MGDLLLWPCPLPRSGKCKIILFTLYCSLNDAYLPKLILLPLPSLPFHLLLSLPSSFTSSPSFASCPSLPPFPFLLSLLPAFLPSISSLAHSLTPSSFPSLPLKPVDDVTQRVERGYRMNAPDGCPDTIYRIMQECWNKDRTQRPNFARIERTLESIQPA